MKPTIITGRAKQLLSVFTTKKILSILIGTAICSFGVHNIHHQTGITEGGAIGLVLLLNHWLSLPSSVSSPIVDITCYALAFTVLGGEFLVLSAFSSLCLAGFYRLWESFPPVIPDLSSSPLLAAVAGALFIGTGVGIVMRCGGSCGGDDALALFIRKRTGWRVSRAYLISDLTVLGLSLSYIPFRRIFFSLITVTISSLLIDFIQGIGPDKKGTDPCGEVREENHRRIQSRWFL